MGQLMAQEKLWEMAAGNGLGNAAGNVFRGLGNRPLGMAWGMM